MREDVKKTKKSVTHTAMKNTSVSERGVKLENLFTITPHAGYTLNMTIVYQDENTKAWAREVFAKVSKLTGKDSIRATWWNIDELCQPGVLAGAVSTAMRADLIVAALDTAQTLPLPFNVWVNTWLPNRIQAGGCLVGLVGAPQKSHPGAKKAADYLRAVAQAGHFEFILEQRVQPTTASNIIFPREQMWKRVVNGTHARTRDRRAKLDRATSARDHAFAPAVLTF